MVQSVVLNTQYHNRIATLLNYTGVKVEKDAVFMVYLVLNVNTILHTLNSVGIA
jgi:hypothetical protein